MRKGKEKKKKKEIKKLHPYKGHPKSIIKMMTTYKEALEDK